MSTYDVVAQLKRDVGVTDSTALTDLEATVQELLTERDKATAALRRRIERIESDFNDELAALVDNKVHVSACGTYCFRVFKGGRVVKVDPGDALWITSGGRKRISVGNGGYAMVYDPAQKRTVVLGRLILRPPRKMLVDHISGERLDNRRSNLRVVSASQNGANRRMTLVNGYKGIYRIKEATGEPIWSAGIGFQGRTVRLGRYRSKEEAARAYDEAAVRLYGEHVTTNQSLGLLPRLNSGDPLVSPTDHPIELVR